jgi:glycogen synthase
MPSEQLLNNPPKSGALSIANPPRVLMLGWEYPPHITGGLGTACHGLTQALAVHHVPITFVIPVARGGEPADHLELISANLTEPEPSTSQTNHITNQCSTSTHFETVELPSLLQPYWRQSDYLFETRAFHSLRHSQIISSSSIQHYASDLLSEVDRYTEMAVKAALMTEFDIIHAHDWMTFKAGVVLKQITDKPLVVHVHSLEYDRCGASGFGTIHEREHEGIVHADAVIAVSAYTKSIILQEHAGVAAEKIFVVHNGVFADEGNRNPIVSKMPALSAPADSFEVTADKSSGADSKQKRVLFFGRITLQKGPEYFVEAARKVVELLPSVLFVMAGQGDMRGQLIERVKELGLENNFSFPGFLRGAELDRELALADLYIMPSKSEPFGISALEAIQRSVPVLLSRQSGVREVILNALSFDFWDIKRLSDLIVNCLEFPELGTEMARQAAEELKILQWEEAGRKTCAVYELLLGTSFLPSDDQESDSILADLEMEIVEGLGDIFPTNLSSLSSAIEGATNPATKWGY